MDIESKIDPDVFNFMSWIFFLVLTSAFYMLAVWLLASGLARNQALKETGGPVIRQRETNWTASQDYAGKYSEEEIAQAKKYARKVVFWTTFSIMILGSFISVPMVRYGFHETWSGTIAFNIIFYAIAILACIILFNGQVRFVARQRLETRRKGKP